MVQQSMFRIYYKIRGKMRRLYLLGKLEWWLLDKISKESIEEYAIEHELSKEYWLEPSEDNYGRGYY